MKEYYKVPAVLGEFGGRLQTKYANLLVDEAASPVKPLTFQSPIQPKKSMTYFSLDSPLFDTSSPPPFVRN